MQSDSKWWAVTRRYTVEDVVYVEARNASQAKHRAAEGEYDEQTEPEVVSRTTHRRAKPLPEKPRFLWTEADWEAYDTGQRHYPGDTE